MRKYYYLITPSNNKVVAKSPFLSFVKVEQSARYKRGQYTIIKEVVSGAQGTSMHDVK